MHWTNIGLIVISILDLGMALFIWLRNPKHKINVSFSLSFFLASIWTIGVAMFREAESINSIIFWGRVLDYAGAISLIPLFFFSLYYPHQVRKLSIIEKIILIFYFLGINYLVFTPDMWFGAPYFIDPPNSAYTEKNGYLFVVVFYVYFLIAILGNLIGKFRKKITQNTLQDVLMIVGLTSVLMIAGLVSVLWPFIDSSWRFWHWIGSYGTMIILSLVGFILYYRK